ncbi:potassium channel family protein [Haliovirga abyssi]|uniref:Potassium transporter TrkA n=1 Tax=Haliovirga abyssi TaxID=2996794 RepID=A0AAU9DDM8_9FUSO|nr:potassium channel protein [Haliovirga abyssi]BDU51460.1 potassium transporter TrkA [Haliovirga abyssi]
MDRELKKILIFIELLVLIFILGVLGYVVIEGYSLFDALYMTVITISTVGFEEVHKLSNTGKIFTMFLILSGVTLVLYGLSSITSFFIEGELKNYLKGVKMKKKISKLKNHYIICGYGKTGRKIVEEFLKLGKEFVVIENEDEGILELETKYKDKVLFIKDDSTKDEVLIEAGIEKAKTLIAVLSTDAENVFLSLTAKSLNKKLKVIVRAVEQNNERKLKKAGADFIISPVEIAAQRIISTALKPGVVNFLDVVTSIGGEDLRLELIKISKDSDLDNILLKDARIPQKTDLIVIGMKKEKKMILNPLSMTILEYGDELLVMGNEKQIEQLKKIASGDIKDRGVENIKIQL